MTIHAHPLSIYLLYGKQSCVFVHLAGGTLAITGGLPFWGCTSL